MKTIRLMVLLGGFAVAGGAALAQGGAGPGPGPGMGMGMGMGPGASAPGMGMGMGGGRGPGARAGADVTPGWALMTAAERSEHMTRMGAMTTQEQCTAYVLKHHEDMAARAKDQGAKLPAQPRRDPCAGLKP